MQMTIRHQDTGPLVVVAKLLTNYLRVTSKITDPDSYIRVNGLYDADFVAYVVSWQSNHGTTPDGVIGPDTWRAIAKAALTCSTAKNRISGATMAVQIMIGGNITADAIYGSRTKAAVAAFQSAHGLTVDGICGPKTWAALIVGTDEQPDTPTKFTQPVDYKQGKPEPWARYMYSNHGDAKQTMANSGCGPTAMADVVATLKNPKVTPWTLAQLSMQWGDRTYNSGTSWAFFKHVAEKYEFVKFIQTKSLDALKSCLDAGGYVVCSMRPGYWTSGGHYICAWKYTDTSIYCNDPASTKRTHQNIKDFVAQSKQYFCFYPEPKEKDNGTSDTDNRSADSDIGNQQPVTRGEKICDISKYQPDVNYDEFIADTALVILRAGYRGIQGGIHEDQKFELHADEFIKRGVRFGVYFYSIADTVDKAREEARLFWQYAKDKNPLFWAMDAEKEGITKETITVFVDELRKLGAKKVGCYVANHLYNKYDYASIAEQMDFTWIPRYGSTKPVHKCDLWQYTSTGSVAGINGNVDLDKITGEGHDLKWFTEG